MITVFVKTGCPYCEKVLASFNEHNVPFEEKNINNPMVLNELLVNGGKQQVPFMMDDSTMMYESDDIIAYGLKKIGVEAKPRIHKAEGTGTCIPS